MRLCDLAAVFLAGTLALGIFPAAAAQEAERPLAYRGWGYLAGKLKAHGVPEEQLVSIYTDSRMPLFSTVHFALRPREPGNIYRKFGSETNVQAACSFLEQHRTIFDAARNELHADPHIVAAILLIETYFGKNVGDALVIERLSRVASAADPRNVQANFEKIRDENRQVTLEQVHARALYLEQLFLPEVVALLRIVKAGNIDLFQLRGSRAGAFGIPQFLPTSYLKYGADGDQDGRISLFEHADAIWSASKYLAALGWRAGLKRQEQERIIANYNNSAPYVAAVLRLGEAVRRARQTGGCRSKAARKGHASEQPRGPKGKRN